MSKKHPLIIRTPENINRDYTELVINIGNIEIELSNLQKRRKKIVEEQEILMGRVDELIIEMNESQKQIQKEKEEEKAKQPDLPLEGAKA